MSKFLVTCLGSIDERLLDYLDEDEELRLEVVDRPQPTSQSPASRDEAVLYPENRRSTKIS
jgi:hypothetical protein